MSTENQTPEENNAQTPEEQAADDNVVNLEEESTTAAQTPEEHIAALQEELLVARDRTMRALADAENTRKRAMKDRTDAGKYAVSNFARDLLGFW